MGGASATQALQAALRLGPSPRVPTGRAVGTGAVFKKLTSIFEQHLRALDSNAHLFRPGGAQVDAVVVSEHLSVEDVRAAMNAAQAEARAYAQSTALTVADKSGDRAVHLGVIDHPKNVGDAAFQGTGLTFGVAELGASATPEHVFATADQDLLAHNNSQGRVAKPAAPVTLPEGSVLEPGQVTQTGTMGEAPARVRQIEKRGQARFKGDLDARRDAFVRRAREHNPALTDENALELFRKAGGEHVDAVTGFETGDGRISTIERAMHFVSEHATQDVAAFYVEIDIRNLGGLNTVLGHGAANTVFHDVAVIVQSEMGAVGGDIASFRHGGDELSFVLVGQGVSQDAINAGLERAKQRVAQYVRDTHFKIADGSEHSLADIAHPKHLEDAGSRGTGITYGVAEITPAGALGPDALRTQTTKVLGRADQQIERMKHVQVASTATTPTELASDRLLAHAKSYTGKDAVPGGAGAAAENGRYLVTADIKPGDLPYESAIRPSRPVQLSASLSEVPVAPVADMTDIALASNEHSGSAGRVVLGHLRDGRPVALKTYPGHQDAMLSEVRSAQLLDDLGIGAEFHGVYRPAGAEGPVYIVTDVVPGDFATQGASAKQPVTAQTFSDLEVMFQRLQSANAAGAAGGDFQPFRTPEGRLLVIDPGAAESEIGAALSSPANSATGIFTGQRLQLLEIAPAGVATDYLAALKRAAPPAYAAVADAARAKYAWTSKSKQPVHAPLAARLAALLKLFG